MAWLRDPTLVGALPLQLLRETGTNAGAALVADEPLPRPSLAELYDAHADFVYRSLLSLGVAPSRAEDAMQDVFIVANKHLSAFEGSFYKAWLFRLAHSVARNVRRSMRRAQGAPLETVTLIDHRASPFDRAAPATPARGACYTGQRPP